MMKCLFLLSLCLLPFVVFSSSIFTSQNLIQLPVNNNPVPVLDTNDNPIRHAFGGRYRIISTGRGALGGDVYLGPSPNSSTPCDNGVFRYNSDVGPRGTVVGFVAASNNIGPGIYENQDINILFPISVADMCFPYTIWKVGDYDVSLGARLLETGGTIRQQDSSWFRIVKAPSPAPGYNLLYCPGPFACPSCPLNQCQAVGVVIQDGKRRLALVNDRPLGVHFSTI